MAKIDELPPDLWPTWRWLHNWILRRGIKTEDFIRESAIPEVAFKNALAAPDYPLPFTTQWRRAVSDRVKIGARCAVLDVPSADETSISELVARLHRHGIPVQSILREAQIKRSTYDGWVNRNRIPNTRLGKRFIESSNLRLNAESSALPLVQLKYGIRNHSLDVNPEEILAALKKNKIRLYDVARVAGVSVQSVYNWTHRGGIPATHAGRAFVSACTAALENPPVPRPRRAILEGSHIEQIIKKLNASGVSIPAIASAAGISVAVIYQWGKKGHVPHTAAGLAFVAEAKKYLAETE